MTKATIASLEARIVELEGLNKALIEQAFAAFAVNLREQLTAELQPLAAEVVRAHGRIDHAAKLFKQLGAAQPMQAKVEHPAHDRIARGAWDSALASLRKESGNPDECWPREVVLARAAELAAA